MYRDHRGRGGFAAAARRASCGRSGQRHSVDGQLSGQRALQVFLVEVIPIKLLIVCTCGKEGRAGDDVWSAGMGAGRFGPKRAPASRCIA